MKVSDRETAKVLVQHYAKESKVAFSKSDKELSYVQKKNPTKSPAPDVQGQFLEHLGNQSNYIQAVELIYHSIDFWKLPKQWKSALIIPIHKLNDDATSVNRCRPTAFTCITRKR
ncbi:hypothetical protein TNIN_165731 [Trichonephila inaurata madagascariensis]|uniref:Uncharacterized protein n=1 Tax=Trichonephila inaurata madagascariensis TaxID=2747483 RepID=A0A8X6WWC2_9ARAC|nr:hypothetical protein TNIN_165731 [Trichonephila inaurata madagascariensis]